MKFLSRQSDRGEESRRRDGNRQAPCTSAKHDCRSCTLLLRTTLCRAQLRQPNLPPPRPSTQLSTSQLEFQSALPAGGSEDHNTEPRSIVRWTTRRGCRGMTCSQADVSPRKSCFPASLAPSFHFLRDLEKEKVRINLLRLRRNRSRPCKLLPETIPESAPGPTIPGPPKTPGTVDGEASGTCSPVGVALGIVSVGLKTLKNSHAKLCTARTARMPQR